MYLIIEINHLIELIDRSKRIDESIEEKNRISQKNVYSQALKFREKLDVHSNKAEGAERG